MKVDIGDGWFFSTKLGTNDVAAMTKMSTSDDSNGPGNPNSHRPMLSFLELYYGYVKEDCGFWVGTFPLKYTPAFDLHFYSHILVDIPWVLYNNNSVNGLAGYQVIKDKKVNWFLSVDENNINSKYIAFIGQPGSSYKRTGSEAINGENLSKIRNLII